MPSRTRISVVATATALAVAVVALSLARAGDWETTAAGLQYRALDLSISGLVPAGRAHVFRFSPERYELRILSAGEDGADVASLARGTGALLAVNGGFFLPGFKPLGLLVSQGRQLNPLRRADWGVFYVANREAGLVHRRDWKTPRGLEFAIEAGPRLVVGGRVLKLKEQVARRTALGITGDGRVVVVVTESPVLTATLAELLALPESKGGLGCREALNLDGGSSTQLYFADGERRVSISGRGHVANAVAVYPRDSD